MNDELPDVQAGFRKGIRRKNQIANICWIIEKAREFQKKNIYFWFIDYPKALSVWIIKNLWKVLKQKGYQTTWSASSEMCVHVRKQHLELDVEQQMGSK